MKEIKVGEYVRDNEGNIDKIINTLSLFKDVYLYLGEEGYQYSENAISKHSKNIIDLIEVGDYVNGSEVVAEKYKNYDMNFINVDSKISFGWGYGVIPENDIKSIVAKEQFTSMEYRLEE